MGIWATSYNLLVPQGPTQAQTYIYHLHLIIECCHAHPDLRLGESDNTPFIIKGSGHTVTHQIIVKHSVSTKASRRPIAISQRENSYLQSMARTCSKILRACIIIHLQGLPKIPNSISICHYHFKHHWIAGSAGPSGRAACTATWRAFSCSGSKLKFRSLGKHAGGTHSNEEYVTSKIQKAHQV